MPESAKPRVAVIGLGSMGFGMATSLRRAGLEVTGCDVSADSVKRFVADGGKGAGTPAEAAKTADIVVSVVVNAAQTETILFGANGVAETLGKGAVFVSSATMDPDVARRLAKQLEATGRHYLDAPISGGAQRAAQGELTILASGSPAAFAKARPALDAMAAKLYELGDDAGQGAAFKMINQLLAGVHIAAASEAIAFAAKQGLDIRKVYEVITASAGNSWMFENRMPHVLDGDYTPRSAVEIFVKDLGIIQDMARSQKFPVPVAAAALQMFLMTAASGMGRDDDASVARMYAQRHRHASARRTEIEARSKRGRSMPRFAANLSMMFTEVPFLDRFDAAAKAGFTSVEFLFPYDHPAEAVGERLKRNGLTQALFNLPPGNWDAGEKGFAALPERFDDLKRSLETALPYAKATGVKRLHLMAGIANRSEAKAVEQFYKSVAWAAEFFAPHGLDVVIEPINARNVPGYFLNDFRLRARPDHRAEDSEPETAVRHLSLPDHSWRRHHAAARDDADHRPRPDRQHSLAQRARRRGAELSVPVRRARPARLWRLRRLRI